MIFKSEKNMNPPLKLAPTPKHFKKDSDISLLINLQDLLKLMLKASEMVEDQGKNKKNGFEDINLHKNLKKQHKLVCLKSRELENQLEIYKYHFGETDQSIDVFIRHSEFLEDHEDLMEAFFGWVEDIGDE